MAGKKGMRHARPRNEAERDMHALVRIEYLIDQIAEKHALTCQECGGHIPLKDLSPQAVTLLKARYDKLRATKTEATVTHKTSLVDALSKITEADQHVSPRKPVEDQPSVH